MFESMAEAVEFAKRAYPGCSFSVREQEDGPTIISIRQRVQETDRLEIVREVVYVRRTDRNEAANSKTA